MKNEKQINEAIRDGYSIDDIFVNPLIILNIDNPTSDEKNSALYGIWECESIRWKHILTKRLAGIFTQKDIILAIKSTYNIDWNNMPINDISGILSEVINILDGDYDNKILNKLSKNINMLNKFLLSSDPEDAFKILDNVKFTTMVSLITLTDKSRNVISVPDSDRTLILNGLENLTTLQTLVMLKSNVNLIGYSLDISRDFYMKYDISVEAIISCIGKRHISNKILKLLIASLPEDNIEHIKLMTTTFTNAESNILDIYEELVDDGTLSMSNASLIHYSREYLRYPSKRALDFVVEDYDNIANLCGYHDIHIVNAAIKADKRALFNCRLKDQ